MLNLCFHLRDRKVRDFKKKVRPDSWNGSDVCLEQSAYWRLLRKSSASVPSIKDYKIDKEYKIGFKRKGQEASLR